MSPFHRSCCGWVSSILNETKLVRNKVYQLINKSYLNYRLLLLLKNTICTPFQQRFIDSLLIKI